MPTYSHSKLTCFEQCRYQYKLKYIDKIKVEQPQTVETFMGLCVHAALEKLYTDLLHQKLPSCDEVLAFYDVRWDAKWEDTIRIVKTQYSAAHYKAMGRKFVADYYAHYEPFDQTRIMGLETEDLLDIGPDRKFHVRIDRLSRDADGVYYVCDYKTNSHLKSQTDVDKDRQLAMYSIWVHAHYPDCKKVKLVWYFLAHDVERVSERSATQLEQLKTDVLARIAEIENCTSYPTSVSSLCEWCAYKPICPAWKHGEELHTKEPAQISQDEGVQLANRYADLHAQKKELESELDAIKEQLILFATQHEVETVFGTDKKISVKESDHYSFSDKESRKDLIEILKRCEVWDEFSDVNTFKLAKALQEHRLPETLHQQLLSFAEKKHSWTLRVGKRGAAQ